MKYKNILLLLIVALSFVLASCDDEKMEWHKDPTHGDVTESEIPLLLAEKITRYDALKSYATFPLGIGVGLEEYMEKEAYRAIVEENFDEITIGYAMKHGPMVNAKGEINFKKVDALMERLQSVGLGLYGHTLIWHQNQNAGYLNSLIAPEIIPGGSGESLIVNGSFEDGLTGWNIPNYKDNVSAVTDHAIDGEHSMKVVVGDFGGGKYNMQVNSPSFSLIKGHKYEISFYIKSDGEGKIGLDFPNASLGNQYPWTDGKELVPTNATWTKVTYNPTMTPDGMTASKDEAEMTFRLLLGEVSNVTYYIDAVEVIDLDAEPTVVNLISNGDFESGAIAPWTGWGNGSSRDISENGEGFGDKGYAMKLVNPTDANNYSAQAKIDFIQPLEKGKKHKVELWIKSPIKSSIQMQLQKPETETEKGKASYSGDRDIEVGWTLLEWEFDADESYVSFFIDFGTKAATYYVDNVVVQQLGGVAKAVGKSAIIIEKTDEEKAEIIGNAMESWISQMVSHCKVLVKAWDVVNEPMDDGKPSSLKTGIGKTDLASDEFYWQDYLGKDYAVKAFKLAREHGNPDDKLFINDYNLEYNLAKCDGLIAYVEYIESQGAKVDGIGTQMHIAINSNKDNIEQMFQKLGATGKLIKVTELDIKVNTPSPTAAELAEQAEMYRYVMEMYMKHIPEARRHSVTIWGLSDDPAEHEHWIPDDAPNLWNKDYQRKHAYKGVADGLAGRDVSEDFTGELQY